MGSCLILSHGAGSNREAPLLIAVDQAIQSIGVHVIRINLPFREARPSGPPRQGDPERDRQGLRDAVGRAMVEFGGPVYLGGHSYGGRQSSMLAAEQPDLVAGLLLLSYPLHPPRKPTELRTAHLPNLRTPSLWIHGSRDPFGSIQEVRAAMELLPQKAELVEIAGAGHELSRRSAAMSEVAGRIAQEFQRFFAEAVSPRAERA